MDGVESAPLKLFFTHVAGECGCCRSHGYPRCNQSIGLPTGDENRIAAGARGEESGVREPANCSFALTSDFPAKMSENDAKSAVFAKMALSATQRHRFAQKRH